MHSCLLLVFSEPGDASAFASVFDITSKAKRKSHFLRTEAYLEKSKITSTFNSPQSSPTVDPQCGLEQRQNLAEAAVPLALLGGNSCSSSQVAQSQGTLSTRTRSPWDGCRHPLYLPVSGSTSLPLPLALCSSWSDRHPLQELYLCPPLQG